MALARPDRRWNVAAAGADPPPSCGICHTLRPLLSASAGSLEHSKFLEGVLQRKVHWEKIAVFVETVVVCVAAVLHESVVKLLIVHDVA